MYFFIAIVFIAGTGFVVYAIGEFISSREQKRIAERKKLLEDELSQKQQRREREKIRKRLELIEKKRAEQRRKEEEQRRKEELIIRKRKLEEERKTARQLALAKKKAKELLESKWKSNWRDFKETLERENIKSIYHFTDYQNIESIKKHGGLYSWKLCENKNIPIAMPGGSFTSRSLDSYHNLEDYVRLCFSRNHPMMYVAINEGRITNPAILEIDPEVVYWKQTRFSDMNATKNGHRQGSTIDDFKRIKFDVVKQINHFNLSDEDKPFYQAEVMVKSFIPLKYIKNIQ